MFCRNCGSPLNPGERFCTRCGKEVSAPPAEPAQELRQAQQAPASVSAPSPAAAEPRKRPKGRCWLFGGVGTAVGALLLAVILFAAGVLSFGGPAGQTTEGPGFATPEDAARAYLEGLRDQDMNAMLSAFAVETYVDNYDFEAMVERIKSYQPSLEIRLPGNTEYNRQLNVASRRGQLTSLILNQYMYYNAPDELAEFSPIVLTEEGEVSDFVESFERDTGDYVFADLVIGDFVEPEDVSDQYMTEANLNNIARQAKIFGVNENGVANIAVKFEADGQDWLFCPQAVCYDGKWYLQSLQGNLAILANMAVYTGGIAPMNAIG